MAIAPSGKMKQGFLWKAGVKSLGERGMGPPRRGEKGKGRAEWAKMRVLRGFGAASNGKTMNQWPTMKRLFSATMFLVCVFKL